MTDADLIKHLWTHKTQDHPSWSDEDLMIERGSGVYVWNRKGRRLFDAYAGLAVAETVHGLQDEVTRSARGSVAA